MTFKLGILLPQSKQYPSIGRDFIDGLQLALAHLQIEWYIEGIGNSSDMNQIINALQKLQFQHRVHLVTGFLGHHQIERLHHQINELDSLLLYSDLGATLPSGLGASPNVFCNSFNMVQSSLLAAGQMAARGCSKVVVSTSFYDSGYGLSLALEKGLNQTGGAFAGHFVTPLNPRINESELMHQFMSNLNADVIFAQYSGIFAREYATFLQQNELLQRIPVYATHFTIEDALLTDFPEIFDGTRCTTSWIVEEEASANQTFVRNYRNAYKRTPSVFSLLGYENGMAIAQMLQKTDQYSTAQLKQALSQVCFDAPRGVFTFYPQTKRTYFAHHEWLLEYCGEGYRKNKQFTQKPMPEQDLEWMQTFLHSSSGWFNAYLCQ